LVASISVIIPHFRRADLISATLDSVLQQSLEPLEIIVVDDASGGDTVKSLERFEPEIKLITLAENVGVSEARNLGVKAASGVYVAFLDSDDLWEPQKLATQWAYLQSHPECDAVHTGVRVDTPGGTTASYTNKPQRLKIEDLVRSSHVMVQSLMMKKQDFIELGGFDRSFSQTEDYEFSMRMVTSGIKLDFIPDPLVILNRGRTDHLSQSWTGYLRGHIRIVWRYSNFYRQVDGYFSPLKYTGKYLASGGRKRGGIAGYLVSLVGLAVSKFFS